MADVKVVYTEKQKQKKTSECEGCGRRGARFRSCTQEYLCAMCRRRPENRLCNKTYAQKHFNLSSDELEAALPYCTTNNNINPSRPVKLFWHRHVEALSRDLNSLYRPPLWPGNRSFHDGAAPRVEFVDDDVEFID